MINNCIDYNINLQHFNYVISPNTETQNLIKIENFINIYNNLLIDDKQTNYINDDDIDIKNYKQRKKIEQFLIANKFLTTNITKESPFIEYLINKRMNFCKIGTSSHIAALISVSLNNWYCFKFHTKWKSRYR